jgi:DNA-binding response OmpR family regulator/two-component sensor histidine kinase
VEVIHRNAQRLLKLVNSLLDFNRLQSGRAGTRFQPVDLARYTTELASMFQSAVDDAGLDLRIEAPPLPEPVYVDRDGWAHVVLNLVSNALKYTFEGAITVRLAERAGRARLEVADTGVGIPLAEQPRLFERFHRVAGTRSRTHEGSGIGLALVAELAALHGGDAGVISAPGEGSTFSVEVPFGTEHLPPDQLAPADGDADHVDRQARSFVDEALRWLEPAAQAGPVPADGHGPAGDRARVLVVDDNADMRGYVAGLLAERYLVQTAPDGAVALELARRRPPDLVLTDVMMPNLDGFGLLAALREEPATTHVPVIMLSARAGEDGTIEGLEAGADDYLAKPFAARELLARVRANLELERVRTTRDQLRRSQALLDQAQRLAAVGSWELDLRTGSITASDEFVRQMRVSRAELQDAGLERLMSTRVHPDDRALVRAAIERATLRGEAIDFEVRLRFGDDVRRFRTIGEVERDEDGRPARLRGSNQDITEQRAAQEALAAVAAEREAAAREHRIADQLQRSLLPELVFDPERLDVASVYRPGVIGTRVGGDWYDLIDLGDDDHTAVVIGDVMGRGVRAAAVMGQLRATVRAYARLGLGPAALLEQLDGVVRDLGDEQIVTCVFGVHEASTGSFTYASAGHLPPLLQMPGEPPRRLSCAGLLLGSGPMRLAEERVALPPGARLVLYTDGLVERRDRPIDDGIDRLAGLLSELPPGVTGLPDALVDRLAPGDGDDDVAVLVAGAPEAGPEPRGASLQVEQEIGAGDQPIRAARTLVRETLAQWRVRERTAGDAVLLVSEMVTNAILHGLPTIRLRLRRSPADGLVIEVDDGARVPPRRRHPTPDDEHGRGLQLVAMLAGRWGTRPTASGKTVWCHMPLE